LLLFVALRRAGGIRHVALGATVLDTIAANPWLFARLPQGDFTVEATDQGATLSSKIAIKGTSRRQWEFHFDAPATE
jgi:hypothetical protein